MNNTPFSVYYDGTMIFRMNNPLRYYPWGSKTLLPEYLGLSNDEGRPWAELWMGAHPSGSSSVVFPGGGERDLREFLAVDPALLLGVAAAVRFSRELPFLFKIIAADRPLSIQCHPDLERARNGFAEENARGLAQDSPERNYRDPNHKPEVLLALSPFKVLGGFRRPGEILAFFKSLPVPELQSLAESTLGNGKGDLEEFLERILLLPRTESAGLAARVLEAARGREESEFSWFKTFTDLHPGDPGCFAAFYLNSIDLRPGEALFIGAGELHAYLGGMGLELMANSDNVLRGGLTEKRVDVAELLDAAVFRPGTPKRLSPAPAAGETGGFEELYPAPAAEFALSVLRLPEGRSAGIGPSSAEVLLCGGGTGEVSANGVRLSLKRGDSVFVPASAGEVALRGPLTLYRARVPV